MPVAQTPVMIKVSHIIEGEFQDNGNDVDDELSFRELVEKDLQEKAKMGFSATSMNYFVTHNDVSTVLIVYERRYGLA